MEHKQDELQQGACVDAMASSQIVAVNDLNDEVRWPDFRPFVLDAGFAAVAGIPVQFQRQVLGAVNLYGRDSRAWTTEEFEAARLIADLATGYLVNSYMRRDAESVAAQLQQALDSRVIIEQAKGILAGRHGMNTQTAFEVLRSYARGTRIKLHDAAQAVVSGGADPVVAAGGEHGAGPGWADA